MAREWTWRRIAEKHSEKLPAGSGNTDNTDTGASRNATSGPIKFPDNGPDKLSGPEVTGTFEKRAPGLKKVTGKLHVLVWNRVRVWTASPHTPTKNLEEYPRVTVKVTRVVYRFILHCDVSPPVCPRMSSWRHHTGETVTQPSNPPPTPSQAYQFC